MASGETMPEHQSKFREIQTADQFVPSVKLKVSTQPGVAHQLIRVNFAVEYKGCKYDNLTAFYNVSGPEGYKPVETRIGECLADIKHEKRAIVAALKNTHDVIDACFLASQTEENLAEGTVRQLASILKEPKIIPYAGAIEIPVGNTNLAGIMEKLRQVTEAAPRMGFSVNYAQWQLPAP